MWCFFYCFNRYKIFNVILRETIIVSRVFGVFWDLWRSNFSFRMIWDLVFGVDNVILCILIRILGIFMEVKVRKNDFVDDVKV